MRGLHTSSNLYIYRGEAADLVCLGRGNLGSTGVELALGYKSVDRLDCDEFQAV